MTISSVQPVSHVQLLVTPSPQPGPKKRWQDPHQPGGHSGASPLTLTGWLAPGHASPGHLLSAVQDAPAAALGRVALHWGEASVLCPAGRAVAGAGSPGGDSPLEHFTEARALAQRQATCALCRHGCHALATTHCHLPAGPPGSGAASLLGCCTQTLGFVLPSPLHACVRTHTHCLSSRSLESWRILNK